MEIQITPFFDAFAEGVMLPLVVNGDLPRGVAGGDVMKRLISSGMRRGETIADVTDELQEKQSSTCTFFG